MSVVLNLAEGNPEKLSRDPRDGGTNSVSGKLERIPHSSDKTQKRKSPCYIVIKSFLYMKIILDPKKTSGKWIFLIFSMIAIPLDALFLYIPVLNDDKKCLLSDNKLGITASVLRLFVDLFHLVYVIFQLFAPSFALYYPIHKITWPIARKLLWLFLIDFLAILPLPQVVILFFILPRGGSKILNSMKSLKYVLLFQTVPRVIRICPLFTEAMQNPGIIEATWAKYASYILFYMTAGHVIGAFWYFFAIERGVVCWENACRNHTGCGLGSFNCANSSRNYTFINDFCPSKAQNADASVFNFGIYYDAFQSGIVEVTDFPQKLSNCFLWGLQNLSSFGQGLQRSVYVWENIFIISITMSSVMFFGFLLGYLQSKILSSEEMRRRERQIEQWKPFRNLSQNLQQQIKIYQRDVWREINGGDLEFLLNNLSKDLRRNINYELCLKLLKKVEEFQSWSKVQLEDLCDCLRPVFFTERTYIIREGDITDEMLFVLEGKLWAYTSKNATKRNDQHRREKDHMKEGDFFGEELIAWAKNQRSFNLPASTRTVRALTKVGAFALMADDLKHVFLKHRAIHLIQSYWRFRNILHSRRKEQASARDQKQHT